MNACKRLIASVLIASTTLMGLPLTAQAALVSTEQALPAASTDRSKVADFLSRDDVQHVLQSRGVDRQAALDRVRAMSDAEVAQVAAQVDRAPAGGDILGLVFTVFIVLLFTDILGLTKVFPFTRSVR